MKRFSWLLISQKRTVNRKAAYFEKKMKSDECLLAARVNQKERKQAFLQSFQKREKKKGTQIQEIRSGEKKKAPLLYFFLFCIPEINKSPLHRGGVFSLFPIKTANMPKDINNNKTNYVFQSTIFIQIYISSQYIFIKRVLYKF